MVKKDSSWWHLRVDVLDESVEKQFLEAVKMIGSQYVIARERQPKHHLHCNICTRESESNIRKKCFAPKLKDDRMSKYCHKIEDEDELKAADQYVCKGIKQGIEHEHDKDQNIIGFLNPCIILRSSVKYTIENIKIFHEDYWKIQKTSFLKESKNRSFIEEVASDLLKMDRGLDCRNPNDRKIVIQSILGKLRNKGKGFDSIIIRRLMNGIFNIIDPYNMTAYMESLLVVDE